MYNSEGRSEAPTVEAHLTDEDVEMSASLAPSMSAASSGTPSIADGVLRLLERRKKSKGVGDSNLWVCEETYR